MQDALTELLSVYDEQSAAGYDGMRTLTEFCNAVRAPTGTSPLRCIWLPLNPALRRLTLQMVESDVLETLDALQRDDDADISSSATRLFQSVVPKIWAF